MYASRTCSGNGFRTSLSVLPGLLASTRTIAAISAVTLLLAACGGGGGSPSPGFGGSSSTGSSSSSSGSGSTGSGSTGSGSTGSGSTGSGSGTTAPTTPVYSIGSGSGSGFKDGVLDTSKTTLESGDTLTLRANIVDQINNPPPVDLVVNFSSTCTSAGLASFGTVLLVTKGLLSVDYTNKGCDKLEDVITAVLVSNGDLASVKVKMVGPQVLAVNFVSATLNQLSLAGIGGAESSELTFKVAGPQGVPVVGKVVDFSINTKVGGATILSGRESGTTDQAGLVRTVINSGTIAGPVNVKAVERSTGRQGISSDIVISTGVADANRFSLSYTPQNPGLAYKTDLIESSVSIIASDIFGNNPTDGTRVSFVSPESGNVESSCLLVNGICSVKWRSSGGRPANMRATVLAYTSGAEHFVDNNGNSVFDSVDGAMLPANDLGEPYADENENGIYDLGEYFFDTNKNAIRDPGNGLWDGPCLSKVDSRAVCTGSATVAIYGSAVIVMSRSDVRFKSKGTFPNPNTTINIQQGTFLSYSGMILEDGNTLADALGGNPLPSGTVITFTIEGGGAQMKGISSYTISNGIAPESTPQIGITISADVVASGGTLPVNVFLSMLIDAPGLKTEYRWPINVTP